MEKGYRYMGTDLSAGRHAVRGRAGLLRRPRQGRLRRQRRAAGRGGRRPPAALRTLLVGDGELRAALRRRGGRVDGRAVVGRVRSVAYGFTVGRDDRLRVPAGATSPEGARLEVEVLGEPVPAEVAQDVLYDPQHARIRS